MKTIKLVNFIIEFKSDIQKKTLKEKKIEIKN